MRDEDRLGLLAGDELLLSLLTTATIQVAALEHHLTNARRLLLRRALDAPNDNAPLRFACALAQQCFINEYVFAQSGAESHDVAVLRAIGTPTPLCLAVLACYQPLCSLPGANALALRQWPSPVLPLVEQQIKDVSTELRLRAAIPALTRIVDPVSRAVQQQYEANPYPRWTQPALAERSLPIDVVLSNQFPASPYVPIGKVDHLDVLIAGCGTGQQPIEVAQQFAGARVLAIDLSLGSLAYAQRRAQELQVTNIQFAQADILCLGSFDKRFDLIQATGVLHHLEDPMAGWRMLCNLLRPGGVMQVGLYSRLARQPIAAAREFIAARGFRADPDGIRRCRQELLASTDPLISEVTRSRDFYALSTCRDLLFHVQETCLGLPEIAAFLREHRLVLLGFEVEPWSVGLFRAENPLANAMTDLEAWHAFEVRHPGTFAGMYQFWTQSTE